MASQGTQQQDKTSKFEAIEEALDVETSIIPEGGCAPRKEQLTNITGPTEQLKNCLLYTSPSPRDRG